MAKKLNIQRDVDSRRNIESGISPQTQTRKPETRPTEEKTKKDETTKTEEKTPDTPGPESGAETKKKGGRETKGNP